MQKWNSRKYKSAWGLTWLVTGLLIAPWLAVGAPALAFTPLVTEGTWAMVIMAIWGAYFAANVTEKHNSFVPDEVRYPENQDGLIP